MSNIYIQEPPTNGKVLLTTTVGEIDMELWSKEAPKACRNFVQLCMEGYYDNTIFHRIIKGFCIQGGDPTGTGTGGESIYGHPFKDEFHQRLRFVRRGLVAMANAGSNDNSSQFFFTLGRADELNGKHTIFGKVTGNTIYNMIKMEDCEVDQDDRPLFPPRIVSTEVLSNPFDDIEPRELMKKTTKKEEKPKKPKTKGTKNFSLLSFGEEAEEDEQEFLTTSKSLKIKSSHDVLDDPRLSTEPALQTMTDETEEEYDERMKERVKQKLKKHKQMEKNEEKSLESREPDRGKALREESRRLTKEIREAKRKKVDNEEESERKDKNHKVSDTVAEFREERESFLARKKTQSKGGSRESETLDLLSGFQSKLDAFVDKDQEEEEENLLSEEDDSGWMQHTLHFESRSGKVKDANIQDEDTFEIFDPRNPINKRRREASKESMKERKRGSRR